MLCVRTEAFQVNRRSGLSGWSVATPSVLRSVRRQAWTNNYLNLALDSVSLICAIIWDRELNV